jgi:hypothetical protein
MGIGHFVFSFEMTSDRVTGGLLNGPLWHLYGVPQCLQTNANSSSIPDAAWGAPQ